MKRFLARILLFFLWLLLIGVGFLAYEAHRFLTTPASTEAKEILFTIEPGATFDRVAWDLKKAGALSDVPRFRLLAWSQDALGKIRAGEYMVSTGWTPPQLLRQLTQGRAVLYRLSLREGLPWWEAAKAIEEQGFARFEDFKAVIHDPEFLREHHIPFANAEGFLFPETYLLKKPRSPLDREQARQVASVMVGMFWKKTEDIWQAMPRKKTGPGAADNTAAPAGAMASPQRSGARNATADTSDGAAAAEKNSGNGATAADTSGGGAAVETGAGGSPASAPAPANATATGRNATTAAKPDGPQSPAEVDPEALKQLVTLASLVEKETGVPAERPLVAGVYANRLRLGMLLQCDPTIIYGIGPAFSGAIRRSQLDNPQNPYNTYQHPGLPPGPICSPGLASLSAAHSPAVHDYLYFVATGQGPDHTFSKTLNEHNKAVQIYRQRMRGK